MFGAMQLLSTPRDGSPRARHSGSAGLIATGSHEVAPSDCVAPRAGLLDWRASGARCGDLGKRRIISWPGIAPPRANCTDAEPTRRANRRGAADGPGLGKRGELP